MLPLPDSVHSVTDALDEFTRPEQVEGIRCYYYGCPGAAVSSRRIQLKFINSIFILQLNRYAFNAHHGSSRIDRNIRINARIELNKYMVDEYATPIEYELYGIVIHQGRNLTMGHYYSYVRPWNRTQVHARR
jgi:ubiquitin C-terminal hydrolase